jgi:tetratricopeptide (TPR) repeat protein
MKTTLTGAIVLFLGSACGTTSPSQTSNNSPGAVAGGTGSQWTAPTGSTGKNTDGKPAAKALTDDDFKVRVVKTMEAPIYLDGIQETAQDEFRKGVLAVTADPPNLEAGASHFQAAIEKDPAFREAYFNLGMCLERQGEREDALDVYKSAIDRNPADTTAQAYIAKLYLGKAREAGLKGKTQKRDSWLTKAKGLLENLEKEDGRSDVAVNNALALYHLAKNDVATAEQYVKFVLYAEPTNVTGLNTQGLINLKHKKFLIARYIFYKVLSLDPTSTEALTNLGYTMVVTGQRKKAMEMFQRALVHEPSNMDVRMNIAALLLEHLHYERAQKEYKLVLEAEPLNLEAHEGFCDSSFGMAGSATEQKVQYDKAIACYEGFLTKRPDRTDLWKRIAETYQLRLQDLDNAVKYYEIYIAKAKPPAEEADKLTKLVKSLKMIISQGGLKAMMAAPDDEDDETPTTDDDADGGEETETE